MNKHLTKEALAKLKGRIKTAAHKLFTKEDLVRRGAHEIFKEIPHPSVVKPVGAGSSVGVSIVRDFFELEKALAAAFEHSDAAIIEEFIEGREATCGVIDSFRGEERYALLPIEIIPHKDSSFFDYEAKYGGGSQEICPGNFDEATKAAIQDASRAVHEALDLKHYSRSDFIVHPKRGVYFLEVNTLPGLTSESLLPKSVQAIGSSLGEFLDHVISLARSEDRS
jgi:D-alanine-D-alanine ligase